LTALVAASLLLLPLPHLLLVNVRNVPRAISLLTDDRYAVRVLVADALGLGLALLERWRREGSGVRVTIYSCELEG